MTNELHQAARTLAAKGIAIMPCVAAGKTPATPRGVHDATKDPNTIDEWWRVLPDANVAIACGSASGIFVVDIDGDIGEATIRKLEAEQGALPPTVEAITGKGRHCYFRLNGGGPIGNTVSRIGQGIDTRGDGGYVLAPPSIHPSGRRYAWSVDSASEFAEAPDWLHAKVVGAVKPTRNWADVANNTITEGCRNDTIARLTGHLLRRHVDPHLAVRLLLSFNATNCAPPLADEEVVAVVESIARLEARRRGLIHG